jgi:hypothetical protein
MPFKRFDPFFDRLVVERIHIVFFKILKNDIIGSIYRDSFFCRTVSIKFFHHLSLLYTDR